MRRLRRGGDTVRTRCLVAGVAATVAIIGAGQPAAAQADQPTIDLVVAAGRPLRVALDQRIQLKAVGQPVTGTVTEPVYAYDRIVIPIGTRVRGHVVKIESGSSFVRARAYLGGNFSPPKQAVLQFDTLLPDEGGEVPIDTVVKGGIPHVTRKVAGGSSTSTPPDVPASDEAAHPTMASRAQRRSPAPDDDRRTPRRSRRSTKCWRRSSPPSNRAR